MVSNKDPKPNLTLVLYKLEEQAKEMREIKESLRGNVTAKTLYMAFGIALALWSSFSWIVFGVYEKDRLLVKMEMRQEILQELSLGSQKKK